MVDRKVRTEKFQVVAASATDGCIVLELLEMIGGVREMREEEENQLVPERGGAIPQGRRNRARTVAAVRLSGERLLGSGSVIDRGKKEEEERRGRGFYSCGWSSIKAGSDEGLRGGELCSAVSVQGERGER
jgi:hypothetical protein